MRCSTQDWWACSDLNREPRHYECHALTIELQARHNQPRHCAGFRPKVNFFTRVDCVFAVCATPLPCPFFSSCCCDLWRDLKLRREVLSENRLPTGSAARCRGSV